ncbi:GNAT family N-acetyltransferase [Jatrophihabitans sp. DSM 45814]
MATFDARAHPSDSPLARETIAAPPAASSASPSASPSAPAPASDPASAAADPNRWTALESLRGHRVELRPLAVEHADGYLAAAHSDEGAELVFQHLSLKVPMTSQDARDQISAALAARARGERFPYAQFDARTGTFIGTTSLYEVSPQLRTLAIGHTWLGKHWWRSGHNADSKWLLLSHAFDTLGAARVVWHTDINNHRSQQAIERLGAVKEGVLRKHRIRMDGTWRDTVQYCMTDDDWLTVRDRLRNRAQ